MTNCWPQFITCDVRLLKSNHSHDAYLPQLLCGTRRISLTNVGPGAVFVLNRLMTGVDYGRGVSQLASILTRMS